MTTATLALWLPVLPLFSAAALAAVSLSGKARAAVPALAVLPIAAAAVLTFVVLFGHGTGAATDPASATPTTGGPELWLGARVDGLAALIAVLVGVVATAVQLYSVSYMAHEERYTSYSALISLFTGGDAGRRLLHRPARPAGRLGDHGRLLLLPHRPPLGAPRGPQRQHQGLPGHQVRRRPLPAGHPVPGARRGQLPRPADPPARDRPGRPRLHRCRRDPADRRRRSARARSSRSRPGSPTRWPARPRSVP